MIRELALLHLRAGQGAAFEAAFATVHDLLAKADGHLGHRLVATLDDPNTYLLEVHWRDLDAHVAGFEPSGAHARFMAAIEPLLAGDPIVVHVPPAEERHA